MSRLPAMQSATFTPDEWQLQHTHYELMLPDTYAALHKSYKDTWTLYCETQRHISPKKAKSETVRASSLAMAKAQARRIAQTFNAEVAG